MGAAFFGQQAFADEVSIRDLSGARIDANWFRYINLRFGLAVTIAAFIESARDLTRTSVGGRRGCGVATATRRLSFWI
jgi:hypothetical protein